ncbi:hypothetical protein Pmani_002516 [Petrolisthes manimaculis]|uniref:Uncharacterized protein n=1 Tax=Petrolisthes manimaculis TaxID=1843537 RepID=A0AAE1QK77_9EUCA|nr:hypothetical protein Pmani_002516 [Petrolisthes manimaculis]
MRRLLLQRGAGYTPDTTRFHTDTGGKRGLLVRAVVRLLTTAAARHKALLQARPYVFTHTITNALTHMENTLIATVPREQQWSEGCLLSRELVSVVSGGAASAQLQKAGSEAIVEWVTSHTHLSPALLLALLSSTSHHVLHLNHRNPVLQACLNALLSHPDWSGWEGEVTWDRVVGLLSFPLTNPAAMLTLAAQEGHLLVVYGHTRWRRRHHHLNPQDHLTMFTSLTDLLPCITLSVDIEIGLVLLLSEIVSVLVVLVAESAALECVYQVCASLTDRLSLWAPDHATTGLLAAIGLGRQSPLSLRTRFLCRTIATFLKLQMITDRTFRTHPAHTHSETDSTQPNTGESCTLDQLRALTTNTVYTPFSHTITQAVQFLEDPANCIQDTPRLLAKPSSHFSLTVLLPSPITPSFPPLPIPLCHLAGNNH